MQASRGRRLALASAGGAAVLAAAAVGPRLVDADRFRGRAERALSEAAGRPVRLGHLTLTLWTGPGIAADGLRVDGEGTPSFEASRVRVRFALGALLRGRVVPRRFSVDGGSLRAGERVVADAFGLTARLPDDVASGGAVAGRWSARVAGLPARADADFVARRDGDGIEIASMDVRAGAGLMHLEGRAGRPEGGTTVADLALRFEAPSVRADGRARFDGGVLKLDNLTIEAYGGHGRGEVDARLDEPGRPFRMRAEADGVQTGALLAALAPKLGPAIEGTGSFACDASGRSTGEAPLQSVAGNARLAIRDGRIATVGLMKQVGRLLELAGGKGIFREDTPFDHLTATFRIEGGTARTDDLEFRSSELHLDGKGTVGLDGALGLSVVAAFSKAASADLVEKTPQLRFRLGDDGRLTVPLRIRGSLGRPLVQLDLDRVIEEGLRGRKDGAKRSLLRRMLGRD